MDDIVVLIDAAKDGPRGSYEPQEPAQISD